jgi:hypothetical protein
LVGPHASFTLTSGHSPRIAAEQNAEADAPRTTGAHSADLVAVTAPPEAWAEFDRAVRAWRQRTIRGDFWCPP